MPSPNGEPSIRPAPRRIGVPRQLMAIVLGLLPLAAGLMLRGLRPDEPISLRGFILYLAVIAPLSLLVVYLLLRYLCGQSPRDLNLRPGRTASDLRHALLLSLVIIAANVASTDLVSRLLPDANAGADVRNLFAELARNPGLLVLFVALLIPLGAAAEEVVRVFVLSRSWKVWPSIPGKLAAVLVSACLFGLVHLYQGPVGASRAAVVGLVLAVHYLRFGRVAPLILAHYLTNALQVVLFALANR